MKALIAGALLLGLAGCGWREERLKARVEVHVRTAIAHEETGRLDEAIAEYLYLIALVQGRDRWKTRAMEWRGIIKDIEMQKADRASATLEFELFKTRAARDDVSGAGPLLKEGRGLKTRVQGSNLPGLPELDGILEKLGTAVDKK